MVSILADTCDARRKRTHYSQVHKPVTLSHENTYQTTKSHSVLRLTEVHLGCIVSCTMSAQSLDRAILHALAYADVFDYPLTAQEIRRYLPGREATLEEIERTLGEGETAATVGKYFMLPGREQIASVRRRREAVAARLWPRAARYGFILASLPFVRMVAVTGSLAVGNTEEGKDIDYMIVTAPGFVWTCRAMALIVTRVARLERVNLCPNYIVSLETLELSDRSSYVAHELAQMIPLSGREVCERMRRLNAWADDYLPNAKTVLDVPKMVGGMGLGFWFQQILERILRFLPVSHFERYEMERKIRKLAREQGDSREAYFSADICKGHADRHRERTESELDRRLALLDRELG